MFSQIQSRSKFNKKFNLAIINLVFYVNIGYIVLLEEKVSYILCGKFVSLTAELIRPTNINEEHKVTFENKVSKVIFKLLRVKKMYA